MTMRGTMSRIVCRARARYDGGVGAGDDAATSPRARRAVRMRGRNFVSFALVRARASARASSRVASSRVGAVERIARG